MQLRRGHGERRERELREHECGQPEHGFGPGTRKRWPGRERHDDERELLWRELALAEHAPDDGPALEWRPDFDTE